MKRLALIAFAAAFAAGCSSERVVTDRHHPEIAVSKFGTVTWRGKIVAVDDVPDLLDDAGFTPKDTINISIPDDLQDYRVAYAVMRRIARAGYKRPIFVSERKAYSEVSKPKKAETAPEQPKKRTIRYK